MLIDSHDLKPGTVIEADICIVGSGAAGLSLASEFKDTDVSVVILESGAPDFQEDVQTLNKVEYTQLSVKLRSRIRQFGGSTTAWSGKWLPLDPFDFKEKHWIEHSGWPISFEDIEEYYQRAAEMHNGPNIRSYFDEWSQTADAADTELNLVPVSVYWMGIYNLDFSLTVGSFIEQSDNVNLYFSLTAVNVSLNDSLDAVDCIEALTKTKDKISVRAKQFIIAGGGIENARLLLASNSQIETGIGNQSDNVGRFFMDHPSGSVATVELNDNSHFPECLGISGKSNGKHRRDIGVRVRNDIIEANQSLNSYMVWRPKAEYVPSPSLRQLFSNLLLLKKNPTQLKLYLDVLKNLAKLEKINFVQVVFYRLSAKFGLRSDTIRKYALNFHIEQYPSRQNRVTLSNEHDFLGQPLAAIDWSLSDIETRSIELLHQEMKALIEQKQCGKMHWTSGSFPDFNKLKIKDSSHHMGTTRMGKNEATSVVDPNCKVHSIKNLYIAGSSVFPSSGYSNPTFTIVALAIRLADYLKKHALP